MAADLSELLDQIPIGDIAKKLGVDKKTAEEAVKQVLPGLVSGLAANAADPKGAASLEKALGHHRKPVKRKVADIDTEDGEKIVSNIFGAKKNDVATKLASASSASNVTGDLIKQILPIVAPIVLAWLAQKFLGGGSSAPKQSKPETTSGGIGDLLGGILGGGGGSSDTGDLLGGILGGLLGGGKR